MTLICQLLQDLLDGLVCLSESVHVVSRDGPLQENLDVFLEEASLTQRGVIAWLPPTGLD